MDNRVVGSLNGNGIFPMDSSTSGSIKRSRTPSSGIQVASCLVDGCNSDLSKCREYHRRHKVCELHSKTPKVTVRGQEQRFCQQCSRFHSLEEFDEGKRSCRKRLDGHNRRRRKPQPEPLPVNSARFLTEYRGTRFLAFDHPEVPPTSPILSCAWGGPIKAENNYVPFKFDGRNGAIGESLSEQGQRQISFLQGTKSAFHGYSVSELILNSNLASENAGSSQKAFSSCARSLLSSTPPVTREVGLRHMMHPNGIPPPLHLDALDMASQGHNANTNLNCEGMFDGSSSSGAYHKLFSWE